MPQLHTHWRSRWGITAWRHRKGIWTSRRLRKGRSFGFDSLLYDRSDFSVRCNNWTNAKIDAIAASNTPNDLPPGVPKRAAIFVARCRAVAQAVAVGSNVTCFTECAHRGCRRRFFMAPATLPSSADLGGILGDAAT